MTNGLPSREICRDSHRDARSAGVIFSSGSDRRRAFRYSVGFLECCLAWRKDLLRVEERCRVVNISMAGCLLELRSRPTGLGEQGVWLRIDGLSPEDWTEGLVVDVRKLWFGKWRIRVRFVTPLSYETFGRLVFGEDYLCEIVERDVPEHHRDHFWR